MPLNLSAFSKKSTTTPSTPSKEVSYPFISQTKSLDLGGFPTNAQSTEAYVPQKGSGEYIEPSPVSVRIPFARAKNIQFSQAPAEAIGMPPLTMAITTPIDFIFRLTEAAVSGITQTAQNLHETFLAQKGGDISLVAPIQWPAPLQNRPGFAMESTGTKVDRRLAELEAQNPPKNAMDMWLNVSKAVWPNVINDAFDAAIAGDIIDMSARLALKATGYDPMLNAALSKFNIDPNNFSYNELKQAFIKDFESNFSSVDQMAASKYGQDSLGRIAYVSNKMAKGGIPSLNAFGQAIQNIALRLVSPIDTTLQNIPIGLSMKDVSGGKDRFLKTLTEKEIAEIAKKALPKDLSKITPKQVEALVIKALLDVGINPKQAQITAEEIGQNVNAVVKEGGEILDKGGILNKKALDKRAEELFIKRHGQRAYDSGEGGETLERISQKAEEYDEVFLKGYPEIKGHDITVYHDPIASEDWAVVDDTTGKVIEIMEPGLTEGLTTRTYEQAVADAIETIKNALKTGEKIEKEQTSVYHFTKTAETAKKIEKEGLKISKPILKEEEGMYWFSTKDAPSIYGKHKVEFKIPEDIKLLNRQAKLTKEQANIIAKYNGKRQEYDPIMEGQTFYTAMGKVMQNGKVGNNVLQRVLDDLGYDGIIDGQNIALKPGVAKTKTQLKEGTTGIEKKPPVPPTVERLLGIKDRMVSKPQGVLTRTALRAEARGARNAERYARIETRDALLDEFRTKRENIEDIKRQVVDYAKRFLPPAVRGKAVTMIRDAETQRDLYKAMARIEKWATDFEKKEKIKILNKLGRKLIDSPSIAIDYREKIKDLLSDIDLTKHRQETLNKIKKIETYIDEQVAAGNDVEMPMRIWKAISILYKTPLEEIPIARIDYLIEELQALEKLGRLKLSARKAIYEAQKEMILKELIPGTKEINYIKKIKPNLGEELTMSEHIKNYIIGKLNTANKIDKALSPMDVLFDMLDGSIGTYDGANYRNIKARIDADFNEWLELKEELTRRGLKYIIDNNVTTGMRERVGFMAAKEQPGGVDKLKNLGYTDEEIADVKLTPVEQGLLDIVREDFDAQFPIVEKIMREEYNQPLQRIKNYVSFITDWKAMDETEVSQRIGPMVEEYGRRTKNVNLDFAKTRKGPGEQKIKLDILDIYMKHLDNVAYLRSVGRDVRMLYEIANTEEYRKAAGDLGQYLVLEWLDLLARKGGSGGANQIKILDTLRKNIGAGMLGFKLAPFFIQWTSLVDGMGVIGPKWGVEGATLMADKEWREFVMKFPELKDRMGGEVAIQEMINGNIFEKIQAKGFVPLQALDQLTAASIAAGAYKKKMTELGLEIDLKGKPNKEALAYAQLAVHRTQASSNFKDIPLSLSKGLISGNKSVDRSLLQFQTFSLFRWSRIRYDAFEAGFGKGRPKEGVNVLFWIVLASLAAAGTRTATYKLVDTLTGREEKDPEATAIQKTLLSESLSTVPIVGNLYGSYLYDSSLLPVMEAPTELLKDAKRMLEGKAPETKEKASAEFITGLMTLKGIPGSMQLQQLLKGILSQSKEEGSGMGVPNIDLGKSNTKNAGSTMGVPNIEI